MPYRDPEARRQFDRERKQRQRRSDRPVAPRAVPVPVQLRVMDDVVGLLERAASLAVSDCEARDIEKARALSTLCSAAVRVIETRDLASRLESLERALADKHREEAGHGT